MSSAAMIAVAMPSSSVGSPVSSLEKLGLDPATAIGATLVRIVLVLATTAMLGKANWRLSEGALPSPSALNPYETLNWAVSGA